MKDVDEAGQGEGQSSDLIVHTTLIPKLQDAARRAVAHTLGARGEKLHASEAAVVLMKHDGAVSALIGGRDYDASSYNRATMAKRQPGSAFKPFVYLAAIENGMSPWDERDDGPVDIDGWTPTNYGGRSYGTVTLASALAHSINTVTAALAQEVGITTIVDAAHRCGIVSQLVPNASLALGTSEVTPLELTTAYGTFASGGDRVFPYFVTEVDDSAHRVLFTRKVPTEERVVASHVDRDMTTMLAGVVTEGTGRSAALAGHEAAGKTGTTQDYRDAWFVGFTTDYIAGVWVGNDDSSPMKSVTGGSLPAQIWKQVMTAAEQGLPSTALDKAAPEAPVSDEEAASDSTSSDDEADNGSNGSAPGVTTETDTGARPSQPTEPSRQSHSGFWDWIFGGNHESPPPPQQAQRNYEQPPPAQYQPQQSPDYQPPPRREEQPPGGPAQGPPADLGPPPPNNPNDEDAPPNGPPPQQDNGQGPGGAN